jgi:hypothetical protein
LNSNVIAKIGVSEAYRSNLAKVPRGVGSKLKCPVFLAHDMSGFHS